MGNSMVEPNITIETRNDTALATLNTLSRNSRGGSIGSSARNSCTVNSTSNRIPVATSTKIGSDAHANCEPPHVVTSNSEVTPAVSRPAPK